MQSVSRTVKCQMVGKEMKKELKSKCRAVVQAFSWKDWQTPQTVSFRVTEIVSPEYKAEAWTPNFNVPHLKYVYSGWLGIDEIEY